MAMATPVRIESISQETVDFVKRELEQQARSHGYRILAWSSHTPPAATFRNALFLKERCDLDYPLLGRSGHFHSGISLTLEDGRDQRVFLYLRSMSEPGPSEEPDSARGLIDLTDCQNHLRPGGMSGIPAFSIKQQLLIAIEEDERRLNRFRRPAK